MDGPSKTPKEQFQSVGFCMEKLQELHERILALERNRATGGPKVSSTP